MVLRLESIFCFVLVEKEIFLCFTLLSEPVVDETAFEITIADSLSFFAKSLV